MDTSTGETCAGVSRLTVTSGMWTRHQSSPRPDPDPDPNPDPNSPLVGSSFDPSLSGGNRQAGAEPGRAAPHSNQQPRWGGPCLQSFLCFNSLQLSSATSPFLYQPAAPAQPGAGDTDHDHGRPDTSGPGEDEPLGRGNQDGTRKPPPMDIAGD